MKLRILTEKVQKFLINYRRTAIKYILTAAFVILAGFIAFPSVQAVYSASKRKLPIYCVDTLDKKLSITFDAAWGADDTDTLLRILADNAVKATFFLCGTWVDKYPEEVKKIHEAGHEIGNHSDTHPDGVKISAERNQLEILSVHKKVKNILGIDMNLYRPPFGSYNNTVIEAAKGLNYHVIQWDIDSLDWKEYGVRDEIDRVLNHKHLGNGSIILFHNDAKYTPEALDSIIKGLKQKGFELVPVGELIYKEDYHMDHEGRQKAEKK